MSDNIIFDVCNQIKQMRAANPIKYDTIRTELEPSPYNRGFTKFQLDMRRKVEILKYNPIAQSNQTNNVTKRFGLANVLSGKTENRSRLSYYKNVQDMSMSIMDCPKDDSIPTLTSSCDVPGPIIQLKYEESVPLYNYKNNHTMNN